MVTDRRSWILSVLSALPLMRFLKPTEEVTRGSNLICARCGNRRECTICEMTCSNCLGKRPSCSNCQGKYYHYSPLLGEENIIGTSWANNSADIPADCLKIHREYMKQIGEM